MDRRTLTFLAVGVVILTILVLVAGSGGFSSQTHALLQAESRNFSRAEKKFNDEHKLVIDALASEPDLFKSKAYDKTWPERLDKAAARLETATKELEKARKLLKEDDEKKRMELEQALQKVRAARIFALSEATQIAGIARQRLDLKRNFNESVQKIETDYKAIKAVELESIKSLVRKAGTDWPGKKADLERRLLEMNSLVEGSEKAWTAAQNAGAEVGAAAANIDYDNVLLAANTLREDHKNLNLAAAEIENLVSQLDVSWEKVLADMEIRENGTVTFYHKIRKVTTRIKDPETKENETTTEESWERVDKSRYLSMEKNLGMTIEHKPAGKYDSEATKMVQPPGYGYIASPRQGRNQYGSWETRSGGSFWAFYGQYALMRNLFWGPAYRPIAVTDYRNYENARRAGRTWYGRDASGRARYGSQGSFTKRSYANSKYQRSNGYKNTQFVRTGGTYRGSKYQSRPSRTGTGYSSSRSASRRSSSSRSSWGRSSGRFSGGK